jgi:hypothetical protein
MLSEKICFHTNYDKHQTSRYEKYGHRIGKEYGVIRLGYALEHFYTIYNILYANNKPVSYYKTLMISPITDYTTSSNIARDIA